MGQLELQPWKQGCDQSFIFYFSVHLSVHLSVHPSVHPSISIYHHHHNFLSASIHSLNICLSLSLSINHLYMYVCIYVCVCLSMYLPIYLSIYLSTNHLYIHFLPLYLIGLIDASAEGLDLFYIRGTLVKDSLWNKMIGI